MFTDTVAALGHLRVAGRRDLVDAVGAVHDPRALGSEQQQRARQQLRELRARHADELPRRAGGIRQRSEQVERGPHAELAPHRARVAHRRMKGRREEESDARLRQTALDDGGRRRHAARRAPRTRPRCRTGSTPIGCRASPRARRTPRRRRAAHDEMLNVPERSPPVPHVVEHVVVAGVRQRHRVRAHRLAPGRRSPSGRSPFIARPMSSPAICAAAARPSMTSAIAAAASSARQVLVPRAACRSDAANTLTSAVPSRKFRRMCWPSPVRIDSGWNCTPCTGQRRDAAGP